MTTILIGGDVCPIGHNQSLFQHGQAKAVVDDLLQEFDQADFSVVNLECPLIKEHTPIAKDGPALGAPVECINGLSAIGINAVNLANNHILDHGEPGLLSTLSSCNNAGIDYFGAGINLVNAGKILIREIDGHKIGFLGVAEHEFSIAGTDSWGANPLDLIEIMRTIREARTQYDFLVVLVHGGKEHYPYPTPRLQQFCRFMAEEGASAVICQHSHCIGCYETYQNSPIIYGQGNFIFNPSNPKQAHWYEGLLVKLTLDNNSCTADWIPFSQHPGKPGVRVMTPDETEQFTQQLEKRSQRISIEGAVQNLWREYCKKEKYLYASRIRGHNRLLRVLNRKLHFSDWFYSKTTKLIQRNVVECETHREVLEALWRDEKINF